MLGWDYESNNYGQDIQAKAYEPRAFVATYQKLGYLKGDSLSWSLGQNSIPAPMPITGRPIANR